MKTVGRWQTMTLLVGALAIVACHDSPTAPRTPEIDYVVVLTSANIDAQVLSNPGVALVEFFRPGCPACDSMTETVINSTTRGEVVRWPVRMGRRHTL